jgi:hypothetical protein
MQTLVQFAQSGRTLPPNGSGPSLKIFNSQVENGAGYLKKCTL